MLVVKGRVGEKPVDVLRDTGCSGIVVKRDLVSEDQFTGDFNVMLLIDNTARKVPIAKIDVDTPYLKGQVEAQCLPDAVYHLIIGNVPDARAADDPDPGWRDHVQEGLIGLHKDNVTKIRDAPRPTTKKQIRLFMSLAGYYRDFIPNFAALAAPLSDLTRKGQPNKVEWGEAQEKAYQSIKATLTKEPVLRLPDPGKTYFLQTDASDSGIVFQ